MYAALSLSRELHVFGYKTHKKDFFLDAILHNCCNNLVFPSSCEFIGSIRLAGANFDTAPPPLPVVAYYCSYINEITGDNRETLNGTFD